MGTPVSVGPDGEVEKDQDGNHVIASETSFSAPIQTAMSALLLSDSTVSADLDDLAGLFDRTSEDIPGTNHDGNGISQLDAAIAAASGNGEV